MNVEVHWPNWPLLKYNTRLTEIEEDGILFLDLVELSFKYDVIIDNGKVTFVDKE